MLHTEQRPSVAILDNNCLIREYLADVFNGAGIAVAFSTGDPGGFVSHLFTGIQVALMDICLAGNNRDVADGVDVLRTLRRKCSDTQVLILSSNLAREPMERCYREGAAGYLFKHSANRASLVEAVRAVMRGERVYPQLHQGVGPRVRSETTRNALEKLTPREKEVLAHVAAGHDNLKIAALLDITEHTVKAHMVAIYRKVKPENRVELALLAREQGIKQAN